MTMSPGEKQRGVLRHTQIQWTVSRSRSKTSPPRLKEIATTL